jgi:biotin carboxyl carrier protein
MLYEIIINGQTFRVEMTRQRTDGQWHCKLGEQELQLDVNVITPDVISLICEGKAFELRRERSPQGNRIWIGGEFYEGEVSDPRSFRGRKRRATVDTGPRRLIAPMPGKVVRVLVNEGDSVEPGQGIMVIEAMKMQNEIKSPKGGTVQRIAAPSGTSVSAGDLLAVVE